jgi:dihydrodipicolinate synthase/N-acetylneuraminate lyase
MGEGNNLSPGQRDELLEKALVVVRGQVPVLVWITQDTEQETKETLLLLRKRVQSRHYAGKVFWVDTPLSYHSNRGLPLHYQNLSSIVEQRFILHNDPELIRQLARPFKRPNIRTSILKEMARIEPIQGLIFHGSLDRARHYQKAARERTDFRIYDGDESHFLTFPSLSGVVSAGANLSPKVWQKITSSSLNLSHNHRKYPDHLRQIWELGEYLRKLRGTYQDDSVALVKHVLSDMGIIQTPACTFEVEDMGEKPKRLKTLMERYGDYP